MLPDQAAPDITQPDQNTLKASGIGCAKGSECQSGVCQPASITFRGQRKSNSSFGSALYTELMAAFGQATLAAGIGTLQSPVWNDEPKGSPQSQMYAVYNVDMVLKGLGSGICK